MIEQQATCSGPRPGRPRDDTRDTLILSAALDLVGDMGYDRVSMEAIAARAGVSKATIYRRWPSKGAVVAAAVASRVRLDHVAIDDQGSLRDDLLALVATMAQVMSKQELPLIMGIFAGMRDDPDVEEAVRCDLMADKLALTEPIFQRARDRGERLSRDAQRLFHEVAPAVVIHHLVLDGTGLDAVFLTHLVDDILLPVLATSVGPTP